MIKFARLLVISFLLLPLSGCAALMAGLPEAVAIISDASAVLSIIERALDTWFEIAPPSKEVRQEANQLLSDAWAALRVATATTRGAKELSDDEKKKAFESFREAYTELHTFLKKHGVLAASNLRVSKDGQTEEIPEPLAMKL